MLGFVFVPLLFFLLSFFMHGFPFSLFIYPLCLAGFSLLLFQAWRRMRKCSHSWSIPVSVMSHLRFGSYVNVFPSLCELKIVQSVFVRVSNIRVCVVSHGCPSVHLSVSLSVHLAKQKFLLWTWHVNFRYFHTCPALRQRSEGQLRTKLAGFILIYISSLNLM